jgi:hypothetical protein
MIQDLIHLNVLGKENTVLLANINFDISLLDIALDMAKPLRQSLAEATADKNSFMDDKKICDQAYTHLKEAVDQINEYGQFAFRQTPDRRKGYKSNYMYVLRQKIRKKKQVSPGKDAVATAKEHTA